MPKVVFLHPDLGIGGAERAVIDAALALKSKKHEVEFVTAHHDPKHCFQETRDGTFTVTVAGDWLPRTSVFKETFRTLNGISPCVLYPIPDFTSFKKPVDEPADDMMPRNKKIYFLSINRYERKKNLALAIQAFGQLKDKLTKSKGDSLHLIMAGGYDERVTENKEHYEELKLLCEKLGLLDDVTFLRSFSDSQKRTLLHFSDCLLYTPDKEHFGIVPIEAMFMKCPVIACKSGGPLETVVENKTGFLREGRPDQFAEAMEKIVEDPKMAKKLGENGRMHVEEKFSFKNFTNQLNNVVNNLLNEESK